MQQLLKGIKNLVALNRSEAELVDKKFSSATPSDLNKGGIERRIHPRFEIPFWKYVKIRHEGRDLIGYVKNLSKGGFFVEMDQIFETNTELEFEFHLPETNEKISGIAEVRWIRKSWGNAMEPPGMGVEFTRFEGNAGGILLDYISKEFPRS